MKQCKAEGCALPVFGKGYCKRHQYLRSDLTPFNPSKAKSGYVIPKKKKSASEQSTISVKAQLKTQWGFKNQKEMFDFIWESRFHVCRFTGEDLSKVPKLRWHWCFLHILPKGLYPYFKLNPRNIVLGSPDFHVLVDNFTSDMYEKYSTYNFDLFFRMQEEMKKEYELFIKTNML